MKRKGLFPQFALALCLVCLTWTACAPKIAGPKAQSQPQSSQTVAPSGGSTDVGSGGSGEAAEWRAIADDLSIKVRSLVSSQLDEATFIRIKAGFEESVRRAAVEFKDYPLILGSETAASDNPLGLPVTRSRECGTNSASRADERDAINFASVRKIKVNRQRFACLAPNSLERRRLVLHEYLGLLGFDELENGVTSYRITNRLLEDFKSIETFEEGLPVVPVRTCAELQRVGRAEMHEFFKSGWPADRIWRLENDIDCSETAQWRDGFGFEPLYLSGHFDGAGYTIRGLVSRAPPLDGNDPLRTSRGGAFFQGVCFRCVIANVNLKEVQIEGDSLFVSENYGKIANVSVEGVLTLAPYTTAAGGLAARNFGGSVLHSSSRIAVRARPQTATVFNVLFGGLVGAGSGYVFNSRATVTGTVSGIAGGLVGSLDAGTVRDAQARLDFGMINPRSVGGAVAENRGGVIESVTVNGTIRFSRPATPENSAQQNSPLYAGGLIGFQLWENFESVSPRVVGSTAEVAFCGVPTHTNQIRVGALIGSASGEARRFVRDSRGTGIALETCPQPQ